jgi:hypothetical protein
MLLVDEDAERMFLVRCALQHHDDVLEAGGGSKPAKILAEAVADGAGDVPGKGGPLRVIDL